MCSTISNNNNNNYYNYCFPMNTTNQILYFAALLFDAYVPYYH